VLHIEINARKFFANHLLSFSPFGIKILFTLILPTSQLQTQFKMTSQLRPRKEYLMPTYDSPVLLLR